jgi:hypothetical protein
VSYLPVAAGFAAIAFLAAPAHGRAEIAPAHGRAETAPAHGRADTQPGSTVELHQSDVVAAGFGASDCSDFAPDQPIAGQEGWIFQAPVDGGRLRTVQLRYATSDGVVEVTLDAADGGVSPWGSRGRPAYGQRLQPDPDLPAPPAGTTRPGQQPRTEKGRSSARRCGDDHRRRRYPEPDAQQPGTHDQTTHDHTTHDTGTGRRPTSGRPAADDRWPAPGDRGASRLADRRRPRTDRDRGGAARRTVP